MQNQFYGGIWCRQRSPIPVQRRSEHLSESSVRCSSAFCTPEMICHQLCELYCTISLHSIIPA